MTRIVDNSPIGVEPLSKEERHDLAEERDSEEYRAMLEQVRKDFELQCEPFKPDGLAVHAEAMRRIKEKYQQ